MGRVSTAIRAPYDVLEKEACRSDRGRKTESESEILAS
jgi:hypothetical protein